MSKKLAMLSVLLLALILLTAVLMLPTAAQQEEPPAEASSDTLTVQETELDAPAAPTGIEYVPPGWTVLDNAGTGGVWDTNDTFGVANRITYSGTGASGLSMAAEASGSSIAWDTELWSPPIDLTGAATATVEFESNFQDYAGNGDAYLDVSTNGGGSWTTVYSQAIDSPTGGELEVFSLDAYVGNTIHLRWHYTATSAAAWYWHIDNVHVYDASTTYLYQDFELPPAPDLSGSWKMAPATVRAGNPITYHFVISNSGEMPALSAVMTDPLPLGTTYITGSLSCSDGTCWQDGTAVYWSGSLPTGTTALVEFAVNTGIAGCGQSITNTAVITDPQALTSVSVQARTDPVGNRYYAWNFEAGDGSFVPNPSPGEWAWGDLVPSIDSPPRAHSGTKLWATNLSGNIPTEPSDHYLTRTVRLPADPTGEIYMQWWDWWNEDGADEGYIYINTITDTLYAIDSDQLSWEHHVVDLSPWAGQVVDIVFYHFSGGSLTGGAGWYLDDVTIHGGCGELRLAPSHQVGSACRTEVATYTLQLENNTWQTDTFDIHVSDNTWDTWVEPLSVTLSSGASEIITAYVDVPCWAMAGAQDLATVVVQSTSFLTVAELETVVPLGTHWEDRALAPGAGARYPAVVYWHGNLFQMGGENPDAVTATFRYDVAADTWYTMSSMITPVMQMDGAAIDGHIYIPGGDEDPGADYSRWLQIYDTATDSWSTGAQMPYPLRQHQVVAMDGLLYVLGGQTNGTYTNTVLIYDPGTDAWSYGRPMQEARAYAASGVIGGQIYVAGGYDGSPMASVEVLDPVAGNWRYVADIPDPWVLAADGVLLDRFLLLTGGYQTFATASNSGWAYDAATDRWMELPKLNHLRYGAEGDGDGTFYHMIAGRHYVSDFEYSRFNETLIPCPKVAADLEVAVPSFEASLCPGNLTGIDIELCNWSECGINWSTIKISPTAYLAAASSFVPAGAPSNDPVPELAVTTVGPAVEVPHAPAPTALHPEAVLWNQPLSATNQAAYANQDFESDLDGFDIFIADDFSNAEFWAIDTIFVPANTWNTGCDLSCADALHWQIYPDAGGIPAGDPWSGGAIFDLTLSPYDAMVSLGTGLGGFQTNVTLTLDAPFSVPPGDWWFVFYPSMGLDACSCQFGRHVADTNNGYTATVINPGGGFGFPTVWTSVQSTMTWDLAQSDLAFRLEGEAQPDMPWLNVTPPTGYLDPGTCSTPIVAMDTSGMMPGDYLADLLLFSQGPDTPVISMPVTMTIRAPVEIMTVTTVVTDMTVTFDADAVGSDPITYAWGFGDGNTSNLEDPVHTYTDTGCYTATLDVYNACTLDTWRQAFCFCEPVSGVDLTQVTTGTIYAGDTVDFSVDITPDDATKPYTYALYLDGTLVAPSDTSSDDPYTFDHTFGTSGTYTLEFWVWNCDMTVPITDPLEITVTPIEEKYKLYLPIILKNN